MTAMSNVRYAIPYRRATLGTHGATQLLRFVVVL